MPRPLRNIFLLALTMLSVGLQISGREAHSQSSSAIETVQHEGNSTFENAISTSEKFQSQDQKQFVTEISEEIEELNSSTKTNGNIAASHAYFTSFLDIDAFSSSKLFHYFDASSIVSSTPLYLQHEVFRL